MKSKLNISLVLAIITLTTLACHESEILVPIPINEELPPGHGLSIGERAPLFSLADGDGNLHSLTDYLGKKVVLVFYRLGT